MLFLNFNINKNYNKNNFIKIWKRSTKINFIMINSTYAIYNGKKFINIFLTKKMIGRKLGEFSITRTYPKHPSKDKKIRKKKK